MFLKSTKEELERILFESDTKEGKFFDIALLILIIATVLMDGEVGVTGGNKRSGITIIFETNYSH